MHNYKQDFFQNRCLYLGKFAVKAGIALLIFVLSACDKQEAVTWTHFVIANPLPGNGWGVGGPATADFDGDGDLDVAISKRETLSAYWFERKNDSTWIRHTIGESKYMERALGAETLDIDGDGHMDVVINNVLFRNPGNLENKPDELWQMNEYSGGGHDIVAADINNDGHPDLVTYHGDEVFWFDYQNNMEKVTVGSGEKNHGGIAPKGIGDLNGDDRVDIVIPGYWFENPGDDGGLWKRHEWPHEPILNATYGTSIRSWVVDLNNDEKNDIVYSDCDTRNSHLFWVENKGNGADWVRHPLPDPPTAPGDVEGTGSFHSLGVADFDLDGDLDIFAGEQEDSTMTGREPLLSMKPKGLKERGVIWMNSGTVIPSFTPVVFHVDNPGWHDARLGDVDGDGDIDIVSKVWNKDGVNYHADYWRNDINTEKLCLK